MKFGRIRITQQKKSKLLKILLFGWTINKNSKNALHYNKKIYWLIITIDNHTCYQISN